MSRAEFTIAKNRLKPSVRSQDPRSFIRPLDHLAAMGVSVASFFVLFVGCRFPPGEMFDEIYFARSAVDYLQRQYVYENTHPPVTKLLIALSTWMFGNNSLGWRFLDVVFGAIAVWLVYALVRRVTASPVFAMYGAVLFGCDGMHFVQSRIGTPEGFVVCFSLAAVYALCRYWEAVRDAPERESRLPMWTGVAACALLGGVAGVVSLARFPHESLPAKIVACAIVWAGLLLAYSVTTERRAGCAHGTWDAANAWVVCFAVVAGLLVASKWYGVMMYGVAAVVFVTVAFTVRSRAPSMLRVVATVVFVAGSIYFAAYTPQFVGLSDAPGGPPRAYTLSDVVSMQYNAFEYHDHLRATHPYSSRWWEWPLDVRPILYYAKYGKEGDTSTASMIYTLPNPLIVWLGLVTVPFVAVLAIVERNTGYDVIAMSYALQWLPWMWSPRISFAYHFYVDIPLICACTAIAMQRLWRLRRGGRYGVLARSFVPLYLIAVVLSFVYFYPVLAGIKEPTSAWLQRMWLPSWI